MNIAGANKQTPRHAGISLCQYFLNIVSVVKKSDTETEFQTETDGNCEISLARAELFSPRARGLGSRA